jgi:hypothetical protein
MKLGLPKDDRECVVPDLKLVPGLELLRLAVGEWFRSTRRDVGDYAEGVHLSLRVSKAKSCEPEARDLTPRSLDLKLELHRVSPHPRPN